MAEGSSLSSSGRHAGSWDSRDRRTSGLRVLSSGFPGVPVVRPSSAHPVGAPTPERDVTTSRLSGGGYQHSFQKDLVSVRVSNCIPNADERTLSRAPSFSVFINGMPRNVSFQWLVMGYGDGIWCLYSKSLRSYPLISVLKGGWTPAR